MVTSNRREMVQRTLGLFALPQSPESPANPLPSSRSPISLDWNGLSADLIDYVNEGLASCIYGIRNDASSADDLISAARKINFAGHHMEEVGFDDVFKDGASAVTAAEIDVSRPLGLDESVSFLQSRGASVRSSDFLSCPEPTATEIEEILQGLKANGISSYFIGIGVSIKTAVRAFAAESNKTAIRDAVFDAPKQWRRGLRPGDVEFASVRALADIFTVTYDFGFGRALVTTAAYVLSTVITADDSAPYPPVNLQMVSKLTNLTYLSALFFVYWGGRRLSGALTAQSSPAI